jgi:tRNA-splicing ligase RtcB
VPIHTVQGKVVPIKLWAKLTDVEEQAQKQLQNIAALPWCFSHVAVMPDVHYGKGATIGSVIAMKEAIAPSAVGVDIGCGMAAIQTNLTSHDLPAHLRKLREDIEATIPVGFNMHNEPVPGVYDSPLWQEFGGLNEAVQGEADRALRQIGTLGGGNHFVELCLDTQDRVWMMLHSGSRGIGNKLATVHIGRARALTHNAELPDKDLAVFLAGTPEMEDYWRDLSWAQRYAFYNREVMLDLYQRVLKRHFRRIKFGKPILCHHNYVAEEVHFGENVFVTRKGAIRAGKGDLGIIPGSMGARSYIVRGLGNADSFESASHGAGRKMSRGQARRTFTEKDLEKLTKGVECRKDKGVIDEIPAAYKDIEKVAATSATSLNAEVSGSDSAARFRY